MKIEIKVDNFSPNQYRQPWIYKVMSWPAGKRPQIIWGKFLEDGDGGILEIEAVEGDVIRYSTGLKVREAGKKGKPPWFAVRGEGLDQTSEAKARKFFIENHPEQEQGHSQGLPDDLVLLLRRLPEVKTEILVNELTKRPDLDKYLSWFPAKMLKKEVERREERLNNIRAELS